MLAPQRLEYIYSHDYVSKRIQLLYLSLIHIFTLIADTDKKLVEEFGVWGEKKLYGRAYICLLYTSSAGVHILIQLKSGLRGCSSFLRLSSASDMV